jgi:riboflavin biosynthesis pyrimidine reductase
MTDPGVAEGMVGLQNISLDLQSIPSLTTQVMGGLGMGIANAFGMATPSPVANPTAPVETAIAPDPTFGLAAMNAQVAAEQEAQQNQTQVANTAEAVAESVAVSEAADAAQDAANAADAAAAGGGDSAGGGGGTAGVGSEAGHAADGNNGGGGGGDPDGNGTGEGGGWAAGGLASARKTENMGRGNDTMLVHMTPNEVRGLQAIAMAHGGSLTINPKTGLVEAGFLDSILPVVAGAALAATGVGAPMAALMVGGGATLMTGSLQKGLMAGLGAFGGAGIGAGLASAGATAPAVTGTQAGLSGAGEAFQAAQSNLGPAAEAMSAQQVASTMPAAAQAQLAGQGARNLLTEGGRQAFSAGVKEATGLGVKPILGAVAAPVVGSMFSAEEEQKPGGASQSYTRPYSFDLKTEADINPEFKYRTGKPGESTAEQRYFTPTFKGMGVYKSGTEPGPSFYGTPTADQYALYSGPKSTGLALANGGVANFDDEPGYDDDSMSQGGLTAMAAGGIARGGLKDGAFIVSADVVSHLGNGSNDAGQKLLARGLGARPIKGKGDGMSDSIPTSIEGKQPARVADGEAYIPPEVVKKVGAKRLYAMMDKIRHARTGTKQQAPQVDPRKFIPA